MTKDVAMWRFDVEHPRN